MNAHNDARLAPVVVWIAPAQRIPRAILAELGGFSFRSQTRPYGWVRNAADASLTPGSMGGTEREDRGTLGEVE